MLELDELLHLSEIECLDDWLASLKTLTAKLGYSNFLLALKPGPTAASQQIQLHSNYPSAWRAHYDARAYETLDPVVHHCFNSNRPLLWDRVNYRKPSESEFFEEASMYGLQQGLALPVHGPRGESGMFCLKPVEFGTQSPHLILQSLPMVTVVRDYAIERVLKAQAEKDAEPVHLTSREKEVLKWSAAGKTTWEIARILSCTTSAVDFHFKNIRRKFQVSSRHMAVLKAIQQKLIIP